MAKKKRRTTAGALPPAPTSAAPSAAPTSAAVKVVQWCAAGAAKDRGELLEALKPLVLLRAAKYALDSAESGVKNGNVKGKAQAKKRPAEDLLHPTDTSTPTDAELGAALETFRRLAQQPEDLLSPGCKALRAALHPLVEAHLREEKASPAFRITSMLGQRSRWPEALRVLRELRQQPAEKRPKLGAYQRWVRELDVAEGDAEELLMLDAVMRLAAGFGAYAPDAPPVALGRGARGEVGRLEKLDPWAPEVGDAGQREEEKKTVSVSGKSVASKLLSLISLRKGAGPPTHLGVASWRVLAHEKAADRLPPNHYDLDIYTCPPSLLPLQSPPPRPTQRFAMPGVEGGFVLTDVLSPQECDELRRATEEIGYRPDVPISSQLDERAHNVVLMANDVQNKSLFERVMPLLPTEIHGEKLLGINRRWRFYRYLSGNLYRKHLDGAWPASGISFEGGQESYVYDAHGGGTRSKLTFIIYLNDDFEGGCTTFFTPKPDEEGTLDSRPIRPRIGSASVFPHGDCRTPLLHEGSAVTKGTKYLLRTDVVYARPDPWQRDQQRLKDPSSTIP
ncbi:unnamed protein product [Durusdinium trenchii]|uniref:Fe2OG dioxygenase domain-containing protein n=1 Tax=Durusdinium trenchii TaxID=1381693 RepID=A0ABP0M9T5_9DINO